MKTPRITLERFQLIEAIGKWEGGISNARLRVLTGLHSVQISRLIASYLSANPGHFEHESSTKRYLWRSEAVSKVSLDDYLSIFIGLQRQGMPTSTFIHEVRVDLTEIRPAIYKILNEACATSRAVEIGYLSMTNPKGATRIIEPHSLIHVGRRWHVRAWCRLRERFLDFNLGRIRMARLLAETSEHSEADDKSWLNLASIQIAPHRFLTPDQAEVVKAELLGGNEYLVIQAKSCLTMYVVQELRAATNPNVQKPPNYQIEVVNAQELESAIFLAA